MMVIFVSQCEKKALAKSRRVLDAFANRIGDNTWQTLITQEGLDTVRRMLRQTASRSTAVSCHWLRSRSRSQLLWVVGNKRQFNLEGYVPVNRTEQDLLNLEYESNWKYLPLIKNLSALAALFHDWGKASALFQRKLDPAIKHGFKGDPLRHEWVSCLLFSAFVKMNGEGDAAWLNQAVKGAIDEARLQQAAKQQAANPLANLPPMAALIGWLVLSHHRLPLPASDQAANQTESSNQSLNDLLCRIDQQWGYQNRYDSDEYNNLITQCFDFPHGLLSRSLQWVTQLKFRAKQLIEHQKLLESAINDGSWRVVLHHARLCLMLGDHYYSSQEKDANWQTNLALYANTAKQQGKVCLKQRLDEHLVRVAETALDAARRLPFFETEPPKATENTGLKPIPTTPERYHWQDKAVQKIQQWRKEHAIEGKGCFIVNMASTGRGKTIANAKVMQAISEQGDSLRFTLALGLRTLTLQTGMEYRQRAGLSDSELAVLIGSTAVAALFDESMAKLTTDKHNNGVESLGSESAEALQDEGSVLDWKNEPWQGVLPEEELTTVLTSEKDRQLLYAPVLACTIDHLMSATETQRGGRYILPCLRLMSSDLVIDEIDDFTGEDLIAIGRLIHLAGMLGRKVMISSATIPPDLALGYFNAYQQGWQLHAVSRDLSTEVNCLWLDEFSTKIEPIVAGEQIYTYYQQHHDSYTQKRVAKLSAERVKRRAEIIALPEPMHKSGQQKAYFSVIQQAMLSKHAIHHSADPITGIHTSFGVVRMANIKPCVALTRFLLNNDWPANTEVRCMAYHSQQVLLLRHEQEAHLDAVLKRKEKKHEAAAAFNDPIIRQHLASAQSAKCQHLIFILVATPVEEVGRDHDFDWAVVEPSSYRSIIQLAGRVRRHREAAVAEPNMALLQYNWKGFKQLAADTKLRVFNRPGYETSNSTTLSTHDLTQLVDKDQLRQSVDARPRILKPKALTPHNNLAHLEHHATALTLGTAQLLGTAKPSRRQPEAKTAQGCETLQGYLTDYWWLTALPQYLKRFRRSSPSFKLHYLMQDTGCRFCERQQNGEIVTVESQLGISHCQLTPLEQQRMWMLRDYQQSIEQRTSETYNAYQTSLKFGEISFSDLGEADEYHYNDQFGLVSVT